MKRFLSSKSPRAATTRERGEIAVALLDRITVDLCDFFAIFDHANIAVFDDDPHEKLATIVWPRGDNYFDSFIWRKGKCVHAARAAMTAEAVAHREAA